MRRGTSCWQKGMHMKAHSWKRVLVAVAIATEASLALAPGSSGATGNPGQVLEWNQIFIDTLIGTNTPNSSSQRLGAIVHTAIFDAYNGVERGYAPIFVHSSAPPGASRRAAVIAAAYKPWLACSRRANRRLTSAIWLRSRR